MRVQLLARMRFLRMVRPLLVVGAILYVLKANLVKVLHHGAILRSLHPLASP